MTGRAKRTVNSMGKSPLQVVVVVWLLLTAVPTADAKKRKVRWRYEATTATATASGCLWMDAWICLWPLLPRALLAATARWPRMVQAALACLLEMFPASFSLATRPADI